MGDDHGAALEDRYYVYEKETVVVEDFDAVGHILDIGGGGEGIIGLLKGEQVVAVDIRKGELEEAPDGPLKLVADARELPFLDHAFRTATAFYSLMYLKSREDLECAFAELFRVLRPEGRLLLWESTIDRPKETAKDLYVLFLQVLVNGQEVDTGYGQPWPSETHDAAYFIALAEQTGFALTSKREAGRQFFLEFRRPG